MLNIVILTYSTIVLIKLTFHDRSYQYLMLLTYSILLKCILKIINIGIMAYYVLVTVYCILLYQM